MFYVIKNTMDKKDIYEHLAKIYLDTTPAAPAKKSKHAVLPRSRFYIFAALPFVAGVFIFLLLVSFRGHPVMPISSTSLIVSSDTMRMSFDLENARKQVCELNLKNINLNDYKTLAFSLRDSNYNDQVAFRVEFSNSFKERSEVYVSGITNKWKEFCINLADFKAISDWSDMNRLAFVIEEWNTRDNKGILFIDDVRLLK
jgi:hypothetical protein